MTCLKRLVLLREWSVATNEYAAAGIHGDPDRIYHAKLACDKAHKAFEDHIQRHHCAELHARSAKAS
jgi:hypothetical protein